MQEIRHLVVLMMENRSFDHVLGYLGSEIPGVDGIQPGTSCPRDPAQVPPVPVPVTPATSDVIKPDPNHEFDGTSMQLFGAVQPPTPPTAVNTGFVRAYTDTANGNGEQGRRIMECFTPSQIPALATLAREFAVCDRWFSSVPGPTWPNRFFAHCASSGGCVTNKVQQYHMPSVYEALTEAGRSWHVYYHDIPQSLAVSRLRRRPHLSKFAKIKQFYEDAAAGTLPHYSFIEPQYFGLLQWLANDQHGGHSMSAGDTLIAHVYEALRRNAAAWPHTMLVITYDEHGGFFDHVPPPFDGEQRDGRVVAVPNPDGQNSVDPPFQFERLGARVPAVIVSPYIARHTVDHRIRDHSAISATVSALFGSEPLTARDRVMPPVHDLATLAEMRNDTPETLPRRADVDVARAFRLRTLELFEDTQLPAMDGAPPASEPINDLQRSLLELSDALDPLPGGRVLERATIRNTEEAAAADVRRKVETIFALGPREL